MDYHIRLSNGQILKGIIQSPGENVRAVIILVHGLGEHIQRYSSWADLFNKEGIGFTGLDLPGHGRSDGRRGNIRNYSLVEEMLDILLKTCNKTFPCCPLFIYGHSLGGGIVLDYILRKNPRIKGAIVTSPWLRLASEPPKSKLILASAVQKLIPGLVQSSGLDSSFISRDNDAVKKYDNDPLVHGKISVGLFSEAMAAGKYSLANASELKIPTLLMHGRDDKITSPGGSMEFAEKADKVELKLWERGYHELHNEIFKDEVFRYIMNWINRQMK
jgi:acylglycerol lipase